MKRAVIVFLLFFLLIPVGIGEENQLLGLVWNDEQTASYPVSYNTAEKFWRFDNSDDGITKKSLDATSYLNPAHSTQRISADIGNGQESLPLLVLFDTDGHTNQAFFALGENSDPEIDLKEFLNLETELVVSHVEFLKEENDGDEETVEDQQIKITTTRDNTNFSKIGGIMTLYGLAVGTKFYMDTSGELVEVELIVGSKGGTFLITSDKYQLPAGAKMTYKEGVISDIDFSDVEKETDKMLTFFARKKSGFEEAVTITNAEEITKENGVLKISGDNVHINNLQGEGVTLTTGEIIYKSKEDFYLGSESSAQIDVADGSVHVQAGSEKGVYVTGCSRDLSSSVSTNQVDICEGTLFANTEGDARFILRKDFDGGETQSYIFTEQEGSVRWDTENKKVTITGDVIEDNCDMRMNYKDNKVSSEIVRNVRFSSSGACLESKTTYGEYTVENTLNKDSEEIETLVKKQKKVIPLVSAANSIDKSSKEATGESTRLSDGVHITDPECGPVVERNGEVSDIDCLSDILVVQNGKVIHKEAIPTQRLYYYDINLAKRTIAPPGDEKYGTQWQSIADQTTRSAQDKIPQIRLDYLTELTLQAENFETIQAYVTPEELSQIKRNVLATCIGYDSFQWKCQNEKILSDYTESELAEYKANFDRKLAEKETSKQRGL